MIVNRRISPNQIIKQRAIRNSSLPGDVVLDPFGGSGTTLIAAEKSGRQARLIELDPRYVDVIVRRWQAYAGAQASREADGARFDDLVGADSGEPSSLSDGSGVATPGKVGAAEEGASCVGA